MAWSFTLNWGYYLPVTTSPYQGKGILDHPQAPEIFPLTTDGIGREAIIRVHERFKGHRGHFLAHTDMSGSWRGQRVDELYPNVNMYQLLALEDAVSQIDPNVKLVTPRIYRVALMNPGMEREFGDYGTTINLGIILYSTSGPNGQLAERLLQQSRSTGMEVELPAVFQHLRPVPDDTFTGGIRLDVKEGTKVYPTPSLQRPDKAGVGVYDVLDRNGSIYITTFDENAPGVLQTGLPTQNERRTDLNGRFIMDFQAAFSGLRRLDGKNGSLYGWNANLIERGERRKILFARGDISEDLEDTVSRLATTRAARAQAVVPSE